ncbi:MAG: SusC/RagA family TonB-linked outer membrane protein [Longimicrobiales bacterium]
MVIGRKYLSPALLAGLLWALPLGAQAPSGTVTGRVIDAATGQPVGGVSIAVAERAAITRDDGAFLITNVPAGDHVLRASHLGYEQMARGVTVVAGQTVSIELELTSRAIQIEGLVAIGYGEQEVAEVTGVIEEVSTEEFNTGRIISPEELIQGKVAGVQIIDSGEPGGGVSIRIRGGTSVTSSNEPLFVVDGVPLAIGGGLSAGRNPLNFLNPADIASMTVLKDASATAIYGSRGANGVILIETKHGRETAGLGGRLTYTGSMSSSSVVDEPQMLTAEQFRQAVTNHAPAALNLLGSATTDWREAVQRTGAGQDHNVAFAGSTEDLAYRLSVGYLTQDGVLRGTNTERATLGLNYSHDLFDDRLSVSANAKGAHTDDTFTPGGVVGGATAFAPTQPIRDEDSPNGGFFEWYDFQQALNNPVAELALTIDEGTTFRSVGDIEGEYRFPFLEPLTGTVRLGYDVTKAEREVFRPSILRGEAEGGTPGFVSRANSTQVSTLLDAFLNYGHRFDGVGTDLDVTTGYSYEESAGEFPYFEARGLSFDLLGTSGVPAAEEQRTTIFVDESRLISLFGRANITLNERYVLTLSLRRDGSSKFGPAQEWGTFPSAAFAWRISDEPFMQDIGPISDLKLRASWGKNGNQAFANYQQYSSYVIGEPTAQYQFGDEFVATIRPGAADPAIKWEETTSYNLGVDYGFSNNRFTGALDYYFKNTEDLIFRVPVAAGTNLSNFVTTNIGTLENRGFEFSLDALIFDGREGDFFWAAGFNAATNDNEIVEINPFGGSETILTGGISGGVGNNIQVLMPGQPINSFFVYEHIRGEDGLPIWDDTDGNGVINDQDLYVDQPTVPCEDAPGLCPDGVINQADRVPFESPAPDWIMGHTSRMGWRSFDLGFTLRSHLGNHVYNNVASNFGHYRALQYVVAPNNLHASVLETGFETEQYLSDYYVEDASFLRMDNLTLGYTFSPFDAGQQVRLFGTVQNVFTMTEYRGVDPLAGVNGIDNNLYPRSRTFVAGANVQF